MGCVARMWGEAAYGHESGYRGHIHFIEEWDFGYIHDGYCEGYDYHC